MESPKQTLGNPRGRRRAEKVRVQSCNSCDYLTRKMSNIKTHVKNVHRFIEKTPDNPGFTTLFMKNPNAETSDSMM